MEYLNVRTMEKSKGLQPSDLMPQTARPLFTVQDQGYTMSQDSDISVPENVILQTTNYSMFKLDPLNRAIRQDKLDRLYDAVQAKNLLHLFPIVTTRALVVIDGQHRLKTAESLGVPIYYIVSSQMKIEDAAFVNTNTDNWRSVDYLDHWCKVGLPDYIWFRDFWEANSFMSFSSVLNVLAYGGNSYDGAGRSANLTRLFTHGQFKVANIAFATKVARMARDFSQWIRFWKESTFIRALTNLAANENYDHARMMMKMEYLSVRLVKCADAKGYLQVIEEIYNHKVSASNKVHFSFINASRPPKSKIAA